MKKISMLLLIALALMFTACGQSSQVPTQTSAPAETQPPAPASTHTSPPPTATAAPTDTATPEVAHLSAQIVFVSNRGEDPNVTGLYLLDPETLTVTPLDSGFEAVVLPAWSADGTRIAFAVPDVWNLYSIQPDSTNLTQITDFRSNNPDWSPDGSRLVFQSDHQNEPENTPDIYLIDADGTNLVEILDDPEKIDYNPRWSPDGSRILFLSSRTGNMEIFTIDPDGSNPVQVTDSKNPVSGAAWSPDGEKIVFVYGAGTATDLYVIHKDGALDSVIRLTADASSESSPSWSPDGERIVFSSDSSGNWDLWMVKADGSGEAEQLTNDEYYDAFPDWGP